MNYGVILVMMLVATETGWSNSRRPRHLRLGLSLGATPTIDVTSGAAPASAHITSIWGSCSSTVALDLSRPSRCAPDGTLVDARSCSARGQCGPSQRAQLRNHQPSAFLRCMRAPLLASRKLSDPARLGVSVVTNGRSGRGRHVHLRGAGRRCQDRRGAYGSSGVQVSALGSQAIHFRWWERTHAVDRACRPCHNRLPC
eukprot:scaffold1086_cov397-Prasinococcus_capsulatus_cf.AAC.5